MNICKLRLLSNHLIYHMKRRLSTNWKEYGFEFLSIFIAVLAAFALNNWNENRRDKHTEHKILTEISNGLENTIEQSNYTSILFRYRTKDQ